MSCRGTKLVNRTLGTEPTDQMLSVPSTWISVWRLKTTCSVTTQNALLGLGLATASHRAVRVLFICPSCKRQPSSGVPGSCLHISLVRAPSLLWKILYNQNLCGSRGPSLWLLSKTLLMINIHIQTQNWHEEFSGWVLQSVFLNNESQIPLHKPPILMPSARPDGKQSPSERYTGEQSQTQKDIGGSELK